MAEGNNAAKKPDRYGGLKEDIVNKLKVYENEYFRWDKPVPFCGLFIYPVVLKDYEAFLSCSTCFTLNRKDDPVGLKTSNLGYLHHKMSIKENNEGAMWSYRFQKLCEIIFHIENGLKCKNPDCNKILRYDGPEIGDYIRQTQEFVQKIENREISPDTKRPTLQCPHCGGEDFSEMIKIRQDTSKKMELVIDGHVISSQDFDLLRQIVLYQNFPEYSDDSSVDRALREDHDKRMQILQQNQGDLRATLEKKVVCLSVATSYPLEYIYGMTMRKFTMALGTADDLINYKIMKTATMSGFVKLEKGQTIEHWIYKKEKDEYGYLQDVDDVKSRVNNL